MALLYPWATKEYLLWQMTIGQIMLYLTLGHETKYGKQEDAVVKPLKDRSYEELAAWHKEQTAKYGDIDG